MEPSSYERSSSGRTRTRTVQNSAVQCKLIGRMRFRSSPRSNLGPLLVLVLVTVTLSVSKVESRLSQGVVQTQTTASARERATGESTKTSSTRNNATGDSELLSFHSQLLQSVKDSSSTISDQCKNDINTMYRTSDVASVMSEIEKLLQQAVVGQKSSCVASARNCWSPFAHGWCCSWDGLAFWSNHTDVLNSLEQACSSGGVGELGYLTQVITLDHQMNPPGYTTYSQSYFQPFYAPQSCRNYADAQAISDISSSGCMRANSIPYADTKACVMTYV